MTLKEELSTLRNTIEEVSDDTNYSSSYLYSIWKKARGRILGDRRNISKWNWQRFCIELEQTKSHNCDCVAVGCDILRSKYPIPQPVINSYRDMIEVHTLGGNLIGVVEEYELPSDNLDEIKGGKRRAIFKNKYLEIYNDLNLKAIQVYAPWDDILQWDDIQYCDDNNPCKDVYETEMGLSERESEAVLRLCIESLNLPLSRVDDQTADRNPERRV